MERFLQLAVIVAALVPTLALGQPGIFLGCADTAMGASTARRVATARALAQAAEREEVRVSSILQTTAEGSNKGASRTLEQKVKIEAEETFLSVQVVKETTVSAKRGGEQLCLRIQAKGVER